MTDNIISFETAKLADEIGFNEYCVEAYSENGELTLSLPSVKNTLYAPTQSLLHKYLRDKYKIYVFIYYLFGTSMWAFMTYSLRIKDALEANDYIKEYHKIKGDNRLASNHYFTYEEALEEGLQETIYIIKNNNKNEKTK